jgi:prepilin-type N-terminal cleavage/methylation domain-containing protein
MLKNQMGFTLIESMIAIVLMSLIVSLYTIENAQTLIEQKRIIHQTNAYHILDNILIQLVHNQIEIEDGVMVFSYNQLYEIDPLGMYHVTYDTKESLITIYLKETLIEVLRYDYQKR